MDTNDQNEQDETSGIVEEVNAISAADTLKILSTIPEEAIQLFAMEHRIDLDIVDREAVQIYLRLRMLADQLEKALDAYLTNRGGYFYTQEELDPTSPSYRKASERYYYPKSMEELHKGNRAALYLMRVVKDCLRYGESDDTQEAQQLREDMQHYIRHAFRILYTPAGKRALLEHEERGY